MRGITRIVFHIFTQNPAINKAETRFLLYNIFMHESPVSGICRLISKFCIS